MTLPISARVSQACCLCGSNKVQPEERGFVVDAVAVRAAHGFGQEAPALVEPDGLAGEADGLGELPDQHLSTLALDPAAWIKVYGRWHGHHVAVLR